MTTLAELPTVADCSVAACSYNHDGCHAGAVTITAEGSDAACATFIPLDLKGGLSKVVASVGACQRSNCAFNEALNCTAPSVRIGSGKDAADCLTFIAR